MTSCCIFDLSSDVWLNTLHFLTPFDLLRISETCSYFKNLYSSDCVTIQKYWESQCREMWEEIDIQHFTIDLEKANQLFESMANLIASTVTGERYYYYMDAIGIKALHDESIRARCKNIFKATAYQLQITIDGISHRPPHILDLIIKQDNIQMFKIYTHNMNDDDINTPLEDFPVGEMGKHMEDIILSRVAAYNAKKIFKYILDKFKNIDVTPEIWNHPLSTICAARNVEFCSLVLQHPNATEEGINFPSGISGDRALHWASKLPRFINRKKATDLLKRTVEIIELLLSDKRVDVNKRDRDGNTALMMAITSDHHQVLEALVKRIDVNIQNCQGNTALHIIAGDERKRCIGYIESAKMLLKKPELDCNLVNHNGRTALQLAKDTKFDQMVQILSDSSK